MDNKQLAEVAKILGVSEDSISAMDDEIKNSMTAVFEQVAVKNDEDKKAVFEALDNLWQKGSIYIELSEVAKSTGITTETLRSLDYETQQTIVYEFMMDSSQTARFYDLVNKSLAVADLPNVAKLIGTPVRELRSLPRRIQENVCGAYAMEYDAGEEVCLGSLLALTLRTVASNRELAEAILTSGLDFGIGSQSA